MISSAEFKRRLDRLCAENPVADNLISKLGFQGLTKRLQADALKRMGLREEVCPHSGAVSYFQVKKERR